MHQIKYICTPEIIGSYELYTTVRAGFVNQGTSLNRWCISKGLNRQTVEKALRGERQSLLSRKILYEALSDAGIRTEKASA